MMLKHELIKRIDKLENELLLNNTQRQESINVIQARIDECKNILKMITY